jgi:hypothetical protein
LPLAPIFSGAAGERRSFDDEVTRAVADDRQVAVATAAQ